jgi:hypothetical protein
MSLFQRKALIGKIHISIAQPIDPVDIESIKKRGPQLKLAGV